MASRAEHKKIVIGLGNPGAEYEHTYHNVGALAVHAMAGNEGKWETHKKSGKEIFSYTKGGGDIFVIPLIFMNQSGIAAREALKKFNAAPEDLTVIHDESDLPVGSYKISKDRGAAGHKGVQSIVDALGANAFTRIRIGIRNPNERTRKKAEEFVLKEISSSHGKIFQKIFAEL